MLKETVVLAVILILVAIPASSASKPPIPGTGKVVSPNKQKPATHDQPAADNERGTPAVPLIIEMHNPPNTDAIAAELKKNREDQASENRRSMIFNSLLVGVGVLQAFALCFTVLVTNKAANAANAAAEAAKQSADSLRNIERAYVFIDYELLMERNEGLKVGGISPNKQIALVFTNFGRTPAIVNGINCKCRRGQTGICRR
jgi:hypothetical protein